MRYLSIALLVSIATSTWACTTYVIGRKATSDGSVMCSHTNDGGGNTDPRLVRIPARDYPAGSQRPVFASPESYPRYVGYDRNASEYYPENCLPGGNCGAFAPIGYIPQVEHTFAYYETTYGALNEKQVGIGESTCSGVFVARSVADGGKALLSVDQLSQIAMERSSTAREAITTMGLLAEKYGFYGESTSFEGGSESLVVIDPQEGWVFHILADPTGSSAIWVAARIPDDSVAVVANMFSIREVNLSDTENFLGSANMWSIAEAQGLWAPGQPQDFTATFSDGEYAHKYYSGRRMWGVFRRLAPSANLPSEYGNLKTDKPYPFAVKVDQLVTVSAATGVLRDWYEGTNYSTSGAVLAAGAFGTPDRFSSNAEDASVSGSWERTIALFRSSDTFVVQARSWLPNHIGGVMWFGPHAAHYAVYVPIMISLLVSPPSLSSAYQGHYDENTNFWASRNLALLAQAKFSFMIQDIRALQTSLETESESLVAQIDSKADLTDIEITSLLAANADRARTSMLLLAKTLNFKYADGYKNVLSKVAGKTKFVSTSAGYPVWWLEAVGYPEGPGPAVSKLPNKLVEKSTLGRCLLSCTSQALSDDDLRACVTVCTAKQ